MNECKKTMCCPHCGSKAVLSTMPEEGTDYPIWKCTRNSFHWGGAL